MSKIQVICRNLRRGFQGLFFSFSVLSLFVFMSGCGGNKPQSGVTANADSPAPAAAPAENASAYQTEVVANGGEIEGKIVFDGKPIPPRLIQVSQDANVCGSRRTAYPVKLEGNGVLDAVVWIEGIHRGKAYDFPPATLNQQKCTYDPHIVVMQPGDLKVTTDDPVPHNVHSYSEANRSYNESMNSLNREMTFHFARPERVTFKCDLHGWMQAFIIVAANPYYTVTKNAGEFELRDVPPGTYQLKVWQETLGETSQSVTVEQGKTAHVNLHFSSPASERAEVR